VPANTTAYYPLDFTPSWVCERVGELTLTNQTTGDKYNFSLKGTGEEPLAESHHVLEGQARTPHSPTSPSPSRLALALALALALSPKP
jgi:hypothetical protein